jgi:heme-degrading monooxygenase HmoA
MTTDTSRLRVVLLLDVLDEHQERFLDAYEQIRHQVAEVPGHISDQLCRSIDSPSQWLITSEWDSAEPFLRWTESPSHRALVAPLRDCVSQTRSLRFAVTRETPDPRQRRMVRHALTFTVKPGSERAVAEILAGYRSPRARVDDTTKLCRTSLFMRGNRVVRAVEVAGDLGSALSHIAVQPEVRAVEEAINPYLETDRDLDDPASARAFFARAALPAVHHVQAGPEPEPVGQVTREAFLIPVRPGSGQEAARLFARLDQAAAQDPEHPLAGSTLFLRDDLLVRLADSRAQNGNRVADPAPDGLAGLAMDLITDRRAADYPG